MLFSNSKTIKQTTIEIILLFCCFFYFYQTYENIYISRGVVIVDRADGAYPVLWCKYINEGDNLTYQIDSIKSDEEIAFAKGDYITGSIGDLPEKVDSGFHANLVSDFRHKGTNISSEVVPPIIVPHKIFRACCNTYKPLTYQLKDWGWKNFYLLTEKANEFILSYAAPSLDATIIYNLEGVALSFNATLANFNYSAQLITPLQITTSSQRFYTTPWYFSMNLISLFFIIAKMKGSSL
ncbi:MAG: hypothetical protein EAX86_01280 [Candidatus Heimdallarchaeota archaeon]|nr:hypothetical protein [Candidatus Heimdallarchaeota archaeon]